MSWVSGLGIGQRGMTAEHPRLARIDVDTIESPRRTRVGGRAVRRHKELLQHWFPHELVHVQLVSPHVTSVQDGLVLGGDEEPRVCVNSRVQ